MLRVLGGSGSLLSNGFSREDPLLRSNAFAEWFLQDRDVGCGPTRSGTDDKTSIWPSNGTYSSLLRVHFSEVMLSEALDLFFLLMDGVGKLELALNDQTMKGNTSSELDAFAYSILTSDFAEIGYSHIFIFLFFSYYLVDKWGKWIILSMLIAFYVMEWVSCGVQQKMNGDLTWKASLEGETCQSTLKPTSVVAFRELHFCLLKERHALCTPVLLLDVVDRIRIST
ncbi:hypothetical protein OPV22_003902 [Ensete ventricosum]|uniref:Uncharacterized protein n=1 Tax=Ensete ventricosum TaxID=4639 RepID=A0AAV8S1V9_ENSVE|nr:hypothetical protein OPV22_003902 [Ensete ventricosum]